MNQEALSCKRRLKRAQGKENSQQRQIQCPLQHPLHYISWCAEQLRITLQPSFTVADMKYGIRELFSPGFESGIGGGKNLREGCGGL